VNHEVFVDVTPDCEEDIAWSLFREWANARGIDPDNLDPAMIRIKHWQVRPRASQPIITIGVRQELVGGAQDADLDEGLKD